MKYDLIQYDWYSGGYENLTNRDNWELVDYYENDELQSDDVKRAMFIEMCRRASHNIWTVVNPRGTYETRMFCESMERALQEGKDFHIHLGFIRLKHKFVG